MAAAVKIPGADGAEIKAILYTIAKAYNHDLAGARVKLAEVRYAPLRVLALKAIADIQLRAGDKAGAAVTGKQLIELVQKTSIPPLDESLAVATMQHENGDPEGGLATLHTALDAAQKKGDEEALGAIAATLAEVGDLEGALKTMTPLKKSIHQVMTRKYLAIGKARAGDVSGALSLSPTGADAYTKTEVLLGTAQGILESVKPSPKP